MTLRLVRSVTFLLAFCTVITAGAPARAQGGHDSVIDGPPPPAPPAVIARDAAGRVTLRAVRTPVPLRIDGLLDEEIYNLTPPVSDFIQQEPHEGQPATERTEAWVLFDDEYVYVSARCWDSAPERMVATEMRRDHLNLFQNENFGVVLDTFYDRRNAFFFYANPLGGFFDGLVTDETNNNRDWNTVWQVRTGRFDGGWTVEMAIPFKSLRYRAGAEQIWGINFRRVVRWKNELSYLTPIAASYGRQGIMRISAAGTLVGIEAPPGIRNIEIKPYVIGGSTTNRVVSPARVNDLEGDAGLDFKYGVTRGLTLDFTWNTDFAQVEDDDQQVNLTRFTLFQPEKREFFLEGQGIFAFGGVGERMGGAVPNETPVLFFSRRIGLFDGHIVPIRAGGRLTGRAGAYTLGALSIQTEGIASLDLPSTNFSAMRLKRNVLRRSTVGLIATHRAPEGGGPRTNTAVGVDANLRPTQNWDITTYYARTSTPGLEGRDASYRARMEYATDLVGVTAEHLAIDRHFQPEVGFLRRSDLRRNHLRLRYSPRPAGIAAIRQFDYSAHLDYLTDMSGRLLGRIGWLAFRTDLERGDSFTIDYSRDYEQLDLPFEISPGIVVPAGGHSTDGWWGRYEFGPQRRASGSVLYGRSGFYGGTRHELRPRGRFELSSRLSIEPNLSFNWIELPAGSFSTRLVGTRVILAVTPRALVATLSQYNSSTHAFTNNIRFRWEYVPGSELFVVYSDGRDTALSRRWARVDNRTLVVKVTRLFRI